MIVTESPDIAVISPVVVYVVACLAAPAGAYEGIGMFAMASGAAVLEGAGVGAAVA